MLTKMICGHGLNYLSKRLNNGRDAMCELSNEQVFSNWQECNRENRQQGADYWHDFMSKRAKRGYKGAQAVVDKMNKLK